VAVAALAAAAAGEASLSFSSHGRVVVKRRWSKLLVIFYCQPPAANHLANAVKTIIAQTQPHI